jgi:type III pantothenate kinase
VLLVIDSGNTNIVIALFDKDIILGKWRLSSNAKRTADEYAFVLQYFFEHQKVTFKDIHAVVISNVVPQSAYALEQFSKVYLNRTPFLVGEPQVKLGITVKVDTPSEVGADRLVDALAAYKQSPTDTIIIDFGTATTFNVVTKNGEYRGGVIAPGVNLSLEALYEAAAKLPQVSVAKPRHVIGTSTIEAMQSGIYWGYVSMVEGLVQRISQEMKLKPRVIATGGLAPLFAKATTVIEQLEPDLTLHGLKEVYELNK